MSQLKVMEGSERLHAAPPAPCKPGLPCTPGPQVVKLADQLASLHKQRHLEELDMNSRTRMQLDTAALRMAAEEQTR